MKINGAENNLLVGAMRKFTFFNRTEEDLNEKEENPVQVIIYEKGKEYYRKSIQETAGDTESYDEMVDRRNKLIEANLSPDLCYDFILGGEVGKYKQDGTYLSTEEKANNLLNAYANLYNKIVQGYENGTEEIHVEDKGSEKGYRILTQEEEIDALNSSYKKYSDDLEAQVKQEPYIREVLDKYMKKLSEMGIEKPSMAQSYYDNIYLKEKDEIVPENISEKMVDASLLFIKQYSAVSC